MEGTIRRRGSSYEIAYWVGHAPCQRCRNCHHRVWGRHDHVPTCPRCAGPMLNRVERRQQFVGGFRTKRDAQRALREALSAIDRGTYVDRVHQTVAEYLVDDWLPSRKPASGTGRGHRGRLGIGTWSDYRGIITAYVTPRIGSVPLQRLTPAHLDRLYDDLERSGGRGGRPLAAKTVLNAHRLLHKALNDAVRQGKLERNPAALVHAPSPQKSRTQTWSVEELRAFLRHVADDWLYAAWLLFATTGMRRGEVAGLAWEDIDLDTARLRVSITLGVVDGHATWKSRPKTSAGERSMSLDPATVEALRTHRARQLQSRLLVGAAWKERQFDRNGEYRDGLVFTWPDGSLIHPERFSRWFRNHQQTAELPPIRLHDVRHTYATAGLAAARGWHEVKVISERLGHANVGITIDTYAHVLPVADQETAHTLARVILGQ